CHCARQWCDQSCPAQSWIAATRSSPLSFRCACSVLRLFRAGARQQTDPFSVSVPSLCYSSTRRKRPHWACRIFLNPRTGPGTRCDFGQNGQTKRVPIAFGVRSTTTAHPGLHNLYSIGSNGTAACLRSGRATFAAGLVTGLGATRLTTRLLDRFAPRRTVARRPAVRLVRLPRIGSALHSQCDCAANALPQPLKTFLPNPETRLLATLDNVFVGALVVTRFLTQRRESPWRLRMIAFDPAFTPAVRVVDRVHGYTANRRTNSLPPRASSLAVSLVLVIEIAHLSNRRHAINREFPHFARRQLDQRQIAFFAQQLRGSSCRADQLAATAWIQFNVVHHGPGRN